MVGGLAVGTAKDGELKNVGQSILLLALTAGRSLQVKIRIGNSAI